MPKNSYVLPKRNPFMNPQLKKQTQSIIESKLPIIKQVESTKVRSNPVPLNKFTYGKIKTVNVDLKNKSQININTINQKIIEYNKKRLIDIYKSDIKRANSRKSFEGVTPISNNDPTVRLKETPKYLEEDDEKLSSGNSSEVSSERTPMDNILINVNNPQFKSTKRLTMQPKISSNQNKGYMTDKNIPAIKENEYDPFDLNSELEGQLLNECDEFDLLERKSRAKSTFSKVPQNDDLSRVKSQALFLGTPNIQICSEEELKALDLIGNKSTIYDKSQKGTVKDDSDTGETKLNNYKLLQTIGKGGFSVIRLAQDETDCQYYAIKIINVTKMKRMLTSKLTTGVDSLEQEIEILKSIKNENCIKIHEVIGDEEDDKVYIITEYMKKGSLATLIKDNKLSEDLIWRYFNQLINGIEYLHIINIVHRDIKPENMLIDDNNNLKIADFGLSEKLKEGKDEFSNTTGTNYYFSPESLKGGAYSAKKADIWACGVTLYQMIHGRYPFNGKSVVDLNEEILNKQPEYKKDLSKSIIDLLNGILCKNPIQRFTFSDIKKQIQLILKK